MMFTPGGNVGIGIVNPTTTLQIASTSSSTFGPSTYLISRYTRPNLNGQIYANAFDILLGSYGSSGTNPSSQVDFRLANATTDGTTDTTVMSLLANGNVGIGMTSPSQTLAVNGGILAAANNSISNQGAYLQWNRSGADGETWLINQKGGGGSNSGIRFGASTTGNVVTENMRILDSGNVGIGTTGPTQKLYVSGNIEASGTLYSNDYFRAKGNGGLYFENWGGGWNMTDTTWIRSYNDKQIYSGGLIASGSNLSAGNGDGGQHWVQISDGYIWKQSGQYARFSDSAGNNWYGLNAAAFNTSSDRRIKEEIADVSDEDALKFLDQSRPVHYKFTTGTKLYNYGFIAQDLLKLGLSDLVQTNSYEGMKKDKDADGFESPAGQLYSVGYNQLTAIITKGLQILKIRIEKASSTLAALLIQVSGHDQTLRDLRVKFETENAAKDQEIRNLKAYLCKKDKTAPFCR
jgi:hypothetical protein